MTVQQPTLKRARIRQILRRHRNAQAEVARAAHVTRQTVHKWLKGGTDSANVESKATEKALQLLELEQRGKRNAA